MDLNHEQVLALLPQRDPIQMIDTAEGIVPGDCGTAHYYVSEDLPVLAGHFPGNPVLPGVYTIEACAQASELVYFTTERGKGKKVLFLGIDNARFKRMIKPGDTMNLHVTTLKEREDKQIVTTHVAVDVDGQPAAEADIVQIYFD